MKIKEPIEHMLGSMELPILNKRYNFAPSCYGCNCKKESKVDGYCKDCNLNSNNKGKRRRRGEKGNIWFYSKWITSHKDILERMDKLINALRGFKEWKKKKDYKRRMKEYERQKKIEREKEKEYLRKRREDQKKNHQESKKEIRELYQQQLQKAREEYQKTGIMDSKRACILLNCQTAAEYFKTFNCSEQTFGLNLIKKFEKREGIGKYTNPRKVAAAAYYLAYKLAGITITQEDVCRIMNLSNFSTYVTKMGKNYKII